MRKVETRGAAIKSLRTQLDRLSTQKELANEVGVSMRTLRKIENENLPVPLATLDRLARALGARREHIAVLPSSMPPPAESILANIGWDKEQLIPRFDFEIAQATADEHSLYEAARSSHDLAGVIDVTLTEETGAYAEELLSLLRGLTWSERNILDEIPLAEELALRRRLRQLLVLLKGNDVWVYEARYFRRLPERSSLPPKDEASTSESRISVVLGPPGEYGETTVRVPVDYGQPYLLPPISALIGKATS
ncbi:helix-turn-helix domain-containing protein [Hyphomicrobium sp.]|uniref:helix-turn-helix domain-containing protein n=1 Tax=Hyphomicrobium sp. TaxID=82 RepID=UPI003F72C318